MGHLHLNLRIAERLTFCFVCLCISKCFSCCLIERSVVPKMHVISEPFLDEDSHPCCDCSDVCAVCLSLEIL